MTEIVSHSGMTHIVNPRPAYSNAGRAAGRVQTLCEFHVKPDQTGQPNGKRCPFCEAKERELEAEEQNAKASWQARVGS